MTITRVESYSFDGQLYNTELEATYAALNKVAMGIVKNHASKPVTGLLEDPAELASLLMSYHDLLDARQQQTEATSEDGKQACQVEELEHHSKCGYHRGFACDCEDFTP